jgi:hypothetical protein
VGAVADDGHGLTVQSGHDQLTDGSVRDRLQGLGIDDLGDEGVFPQVETVLAFAFKGDAGTVHLREAVGVEGLDAEQVLDALPLPLGVGFGADGQHAQPGVPGDVHPHFLENLVKTGQIAGDGVDDRGAKISDQLDLAAAVAGSGRDGQGAEALRAVLEAEAAGEQAVAADILEDVAGPGSGREQGARHQVGPGIEIVAVVEDDRGVAGGAAGAMEADRIVARHGEEAVGEMLPQILFGGHGQAAEIRQRPDVLGIQPPLFEGRAVKG